MYFHLLNMNNEYINKMPQWWKDDKYYDLCLSGDMDSILSCAFLTKIKKWNINYFYSFYKFYKTDNAFNKTIGIDIDITKGKCFSNHVTMIGENDDYNNKAININIADKINCSNYFNKYCGSTLLLILSLYKVDITQYTKEAQMILLSVDSTFLGYYSNYKLPKQAHKHYLCDVLGFPELYQLEQKHDVQDFYDIQNKYNIKNGKIWVDENKHLQTDIDLSKLESLFFMPIALPEQEFTCIREFKNTSLIIPKGKTTLNKDSIFSLAITGRKYISASFY
mgnify:CR=1 FL=1